MQKIEITQHELNDGTGGFDDYMKFTVQRVMAKSTDPQLVLFAAADIITNDGLIINVGSDHDDAGISVANWLKNFYGDRENISYCLPALAYQLNGIAYLLRFPIIRNSQMPFTEAVIDLSAQAVNYASTKSLELLQQTYNEFYNALYLISRFDTTTVIHLQASAHHIYDGAAHYALARWDSLFFIERAMKEALIPTGVALPKGADGHDVRGELHKSWVNAGKSPLPNHLLVLLCHKNNDVYMHVRDNMESILMSGPQWKIWQSSIATSSTC
ncbi:hypothetical protein, partial [Cupriavidus numazuensis]|uniref:hypothetical protein n=2 Tax=Cupriavidus numazuensis TaxID=221992 RepID=UPI0036120E2D